MIQFTVIYLQEDQLSMNTAMVSVKNNDSWTLDQAFKRKEDSAEKGGHKQTAI